MAARPRPWPCCPAARPSTPATRRHRGVTTDQRGLSRIDIGHLPTSVPTSRAPGHSSSPPPRAARAGWSGCRTRPPHRCLRQLRLQRRRVRRGTGLPRLADGDHGCGRAGQLRHSVRRSGRAAGPSRRRRPTLKATPATVSALRSAVFQVPTADVRDVPGQPVIFSSARAMPSRCKIRMPGRSTRIWSLTAFGRGGHVHRHGHRWPDGSRRQHPVRVLAAARSSAARTAAPGLAFTPWPWVPVATTASLAGCPVRGARHLDLRDRPRPPSW